MRWELKQCALQRGITTAARLRRVLAAHGLAVSAGKMSGLWSGIPVTIRLDDLEVICTALACRPSDVLVPEGSPAVPAAWPASGPPGSAEHAASGLPDPAGHAVSGVPGGLEAAGTRLSRVPSGAGRAGRLVPPL
ncbi:helix-turn-helix transcriptional regulator [Streptomyces sp. NPDC006476]|uniref:helix-turn-helix domain-containing protein n=1 Tax=Streptomyces sp. NPDC006476 TaxID=3157175 RepID=UPI0033ADCD66